MAILIHPPFTSKTQHLHLIQLIYWPWTKQYNDVRWLHIVTDIKICDPEQQQWKQRKKQKINNEQTTTWWKICPSREGLQPGDPKSQLNFRRKCTCMQKKHNKTQRRIQEAVKDSLAVRNQKDGWPIQTGRWWKLSCLWEPLSTRWTCTTVSYTHLTLPTKA